MSLRDKYTKEEWAELEREVFKKTEEKAYDGSEDNHIVGDEFGPIGKSNKNLWDFKPLNPGIKFEYPEINEDVAKAFNAVKNQFKGGMNKDISDNKIDPKEYAFAENYSLIEEKLKQSKKENFIIQQIIDKVKIKKANGKIPQIVIMSIGDYNDFRKSFEYIYSIPFTNSNKNTSNIKTSGVHIAGVTLLIYPTPNIKDGEIEIY